MSLLEFDKGAYYGHLILHTSTKQANSVRLNTNLSIIKYIFNGTCRWLIALYAGLMKKYMFNMRFIFENEKIGVHRILKRLTHATTDIACCISRNLHCLYIFPTYRIATSTIIFPKYLNEHFAYPVKEH